MILKSNSMAARYRQKQQTEEEMNWIGRPANYKSNKEKNK